MLITRFRDAIEHQCLRHRLSISKKYRSTKLISMIDKMQLRRSKSIYRKSTSWSKRHTTKYNNQDKKTLLHISKRSKNYGAILDFSTQALPEYIWNERLAPLVVILHVPFVAGGPSKTDQVSGNSISPPTSSLDDGAITPIPRLPLSIITLPTHTVVRYNAQSVTKFLNWNLLHASLPIHDLVFQVKSWNLIIS